MVQHGNDDPTIIGSAVLLWHRGRRYMVTAAHVIRHYPEHAPAIGTDASWVPLRGPYIETRTIIRDRKEVDPFDFAFREILPEEAATLDGCDFLSADRVSRSEPTAAPEVGRPIYLAMGFPQNRLEFDRHLLETSRQYIMYTDNLVTETFARTHRLSTGTHLYMTVSAKRAYDPMHGFHRLPQLEGISGGGIFRFHAGESRGDIRLPQLAAITTDKLSDKGLIAGVRINGVLLAIDASNQP